MTRPTAPTRRARAGLAVLALLAALLGAGLAAPGDATADDGGFVGLVNGERAAAGLGPLTPAGDLAAVAARWTAHMAAGGDLAHNPGLAGQVSGYEFVGENVGYGPDPGTIHRAFMASPGHRANVLDTGYTEIGVAVTTDANGRMWVTEVFRQPTGAPAGAATPGAPGTPRAPRAARTAASTPPPPTPEQLLQARAAAAVAGPGAAPAPDVLAEVVRFGQVLEAAHG